MIATCQFCRQMLVGPFTALEGAGPEVVQLDYQQTSFMVAHHMAEHHPEEAGVEIQRAMALAGAAVAMRYVAGSDARLDSERIAAADRLAAALTSAPVAPVVSLAA